MTALLTIACGVVLALVLVGWSMRDVDSSTRVALAAVLGVAATAFNIVVPIPSVEMTTTTVLCVAVALGMRMGIATGLVAVIGSSVAGGVGAWTVWQIVGMAVIASAGAAVGTALRAARGDIRRDGVIDIAMLGCVTALVTLGYDVVVTVPSALMLAPVSGSTPAHQAWTMLLLGAPYTAVHVVACVLLTITCGPPLLFTLSRARVRLAADPAVTAL